jgi:hypothetical protein
VDLAYIEKFHSCYDHFQRCVRFWVVRNGKTTPDTCLKFYIDRTADKAWSIDDNQNHNSGFSAACSIPAKDTDGIYRVYTVDFSGFQWQLGTANSNDDGEAYYSGFKLAPQYMGNPRTKKNFRRSIFTLKPKGNHEINVNVYLDNDFKEAKAISATGSLLVFPWNFPVTFGEENIIERFLNFGYYGKWIELEVYTSGVNQGLYCGEVLLDFKTSGAELN